jgi:hypothetical protein
MMWPHWWRVSVLKSEATLSARRVSMLIRQSHGTLSKRRQDGEFKALSNDGVKVIEGIVSDAFAGL